MCTHSNKENKWALALLFAGTLMVVFVEKLEKITYGCVDKEYCVKKILPLFVLFLLLLLASCTVTQVLEVQALDAYHTDFAFTAEEFFLAVLEDFSDFGEEKSDQELLDQAIGEFAYSLRMSPSAHQVLVYRYEERSYTGSLFIDDLEQLLVDLGAGSRQSLVRSSEDSLHFFLSLENYDQLVPVLPFLSDPNFEAFGPKYNEGLSEEDYLEMISFMLGEEGVPAIEESSVTLIIKASQPISSAVGGEIIDSHTFIFSFPLIDFLLLAEPLTFTLWW